MLWAAASPPEREDYTAARVVALEADIFLAGQLGWGVSPGKPLQGERRLMLAVLEDAVDCYRKGRRARDRATRLLFAETREWVDSTDYRALFSFESICSFLDIDADYVRRRLRQRSAPGRGGTMTKSGTAGVIRGAGRRRQAEILGKLG